MPYSRTKIDLTAEKNLITGMIVSDQFLKNTATILTDLSLIQSPYLRKIASWVMDYYNENGEAPKKMIQDIFLHHREDMEEEIAESIESTLTHLNETYLDTNEEFNVDYHYKRAESHLKGRSLNALAADIKALVAENDVQEAETVIANYKRIEQPLTNGIDILESDDIIDRVFEETQESLFDIPGAFGEAIKSVYRGDVMAFGGASKKGKSWFIMRTAEYALMSGLKVAYFTLEMKDVIMARRFFQSFTGETKYPAPDGVLIPSFEDDRIEYKYVKKQGMDSTRAKRFQKRFKKQVRTGQLRLYDSSSGGTTIEQICSTLDRDAYFEDFVADVVCIDYLDIVEPEYRRGDPREQNTEIWKTAKRDIAEKRDVLIVTASQFGRQGIDKDAGVKDIAENIRKFDYCSHFISLNQSKEEKKAQVMRINVEGRHDEFNSIDEVVCLQCLSIGRPILDSRWKSQIKNYDEVVDM